MLNLNESFIKRACGSSSPIFLVTIYNRIDYDSQTGIQSFSDQHSYLTGPSLYMDHPCSVSSVSPVSASVDPIQRSTSVGEVSVTFSDDGILKNRFLDYPPINRDVSIHIGFHDLPTSNFAPYFRGYISDFDINNGVIDISIKEWTDVLLDTKLTKYGWDCKHPLSAIHRILRLCGVSHRLINESSLDPGNLPDKYRVIRTTVNTKGFLAGDDENSNSVVGNIDDTAMNTINHLGSHLGGFVYAGEDGKIEYRHFDDSEDAVDHLSKDDYTDLKNNKTLIVNDVTSNLNTYKDSTDIVFDNLLSKTVFKHTGGEHAVFDESIDFKFTGLGSHATDTPFFTPTGETPSGWDMYVNFKLSTRGFSGVDHSTYSIDGALSAISEDRPIYILIGREIIKATLVHAIEDGFGSSLDIDNDGEPYVVAGTHWPYRVVCLAGERGAFGTTEVKHDRGEAVHDITAAVLRMQSILKRFKLGAPTISLRTNLSKYNIQVGDHITIDDDSQVFKTTQGGTDNQVGVDSLTRWEVLSKEVMVGANDTGIDFNLVWVDQDDPPEPEAIVKLPPFINNLIDDIPVEHPFSQMANMFAFKGLDIDPTPGGLDIIINPGAMHGGGNVGVIPSPTQISLDDEKDTYIYLDPKTSTLIKRSVGVGEPEPDLVASEQLLHKITTDAGSIDLSESFLDQKPISGDQLEPGLGPLANLSEDGNFSGALDAAQISNLPDLSALPALDTRVGAIENDYATSGDIPDVSGLATNTALSNLQTGLNSTISTVQTSLNGLISTNQSSINSNTSLIDDVSATAGEALRNAAHGLAPNPDFSIKGGSGEPYGWSFWSSEFGNTFDYDSQSFYAQESIHVSGMTTGAYPVASSERFPVYHGQRLKCRTVIKPTFAGSKMWGHVYFYRIAPDGTETYTSRAHAWHNENTTSSDWQIIENSFTVPAVDDAWWTTVSNPAPTDQPLVARITWRQPHGWPANTGYGPESGDFDWRISYLSCYHVGFVEGDLDVDFQNRLNSIETTSDNALPDQTDVIKNSHLSDYIVSAATLTSSAAARLLPSSTSFNTLSSSVSANTADIATLQGQTPSPLNAIGYAPMDFVIGSPNIVDDSNGGLNVTSPYNSNTFSWSNSGSVSMSSIGLDISAGGGSGFYGNFGPSWMKTTPVVSSAVEYSESSSNVSYVVPISMVWNESSGGSSPNGAYVVPETGTYRIDACLSAIMRGPSSYHYCDVYLLAVRFTGSGTGKDMGIMGSKTPNPIPTSSYVPRPQLLSGSYHIDANDGDQLFVGVQLFGNAFTWFRGGSYGISNSNTQNRANSWARISKIG